MTAKAKEIAKKHCLEFTRKEFPDVEFEDHYNAPEWMINAMKEYTIHIAGRAVEEVKGAHLGAIEKSSKILNTDFSKIIVKVSDDILSRIKTLTEQ